MNLRTALLATKVIFILVAQSSAEPLGFFGIADAKNQAKVRELFAPMLPIGLESVQFGESRSVLMEKRKDAKTKKFTNVDYLTGEEVPTEDWGGKTLHFYAVKYGYNEGHGDGGRGLDSVRLSGLYDDDTKKFETCKSLISGCFLAFGTPAQVISVESYGGDKVAALFLYWEGGKCPVWLRISRSVTSNRLNFFMVAELPCPDYPPPTRSKGTVTDHPSASKFREIYDEWIKREK